ncbi:MAG: dTDP-glucose 4,6-dehydratase, partial [Nitrospinota bacterium]
DIDTTERYTFVQGNICNRSIIEPVFSAGIDMVINFAAESHVDRSIDDPSVFLKTNILGTETLLEAARKNNVGRFVQISTDEVYGSLGAEGLFTESSPLKPNSPYSASKTGADLLVRSYHKTYNLETITTRCSNNYGPFQFPEKLVPLFISNALDDIPLPVYGDGLNVRDWIFVEDHCKAIALAAKKGKAGEVYNIGGSCEKTNLEMTDTILTLLKKPLSLKTFVPDRLGHDRRYAIDSSKVSNELGWKPEVSFEEGLQKTITWYLDNQVWRERIKSGAYQKG